MDSQQMKTFTTCRYAFSLSAAVALLAGCAGSAPLDTPGAIPQTHSAPASSYSEVFRFHPPTQGIHPAAGLLDVNGMLYGTTARGGVSHHGTVYRITTRGAQKALYRFRGGSDGDDPQSELIDVNGTLYGTTPFGGGSGCAYSRGCGTVYSVSTSGVEKVVYAFQGGSDGANPFNGLVDVNGTLYGTTTQGGGSGCSSRYTLGCGTVFSLTTSGQETVLHRFAASSDGNYPDSDLINVNGTLYGTTANGGSADDGVVYSITTAGVETALYAFQGSPNDGRQPVGLIDVNGTLYGTTVYGGGNSCTGIGCGTVYSISTSGSEKVLYNFKGGSDGDQPQAALVKLGGALYGTTYAGGGGSPCSYLGDYCGTVFSVTPSGKEKVLYSFKGGTDGELPASSLTVVKGALYGTTPFGGDHDACCKSYGYGYGTVFSVSP